MKDTDKVIHLNERQNRIMEIMRQQNAVSVATLSSLMKVSEVTIRKDLTMLEEQRMLYLRARFGHSREPLRLLPLGGR
jgi:Transcriptional regulators of sugar metabolism